MNQTMQTMLGRLIVRPLATEEGGQTREIALDGRDVAIGRSPACDVVLEGDQLVSRRHALLRYSGSRYTIVDLGSSNGTYVNDQEIHQTTPLNDGDLITIGEHELLYSTQASSGAGYAPVAQQEQPPSAGSMVETDLHPVAGNGATRAAFAAEAISESLAAPQAAASWPQPFQPLAQPTPSQWSYPPSTPQPPQPAEPAIPPRGQQETQPQPSLQPPLTAQPSAPTPSFQPAQPQPAQQTLAPARGGASGPRNTSASLEAVRVRLEEANQQLRAMEEDARLSEQRHQALIQARDRLNTLLAEQRRLQAATPSAPGPQPANQDLSGLIAIVRQAADNPQHIHYMMQLSLHAGEIAEALEAAQARQSQPAATGSAPASLLADLDELRAWLDRFAD